MREWEKVTAAEARVPAEAVAKFQRKLERERCLIHGYAMLDKGKLLAEAYYAPFTADTLHRMYSVGKSFVSLAIGLLQEEGKLALDDCICDYFTDKAKVTGVECRYVLSETDTRVYPYEEMHPWLQQLTIRQMLTMTTCHAKTTYKLFDGDWVESFFRVQPTNLPGAVFAYDTSSTHVLSALVEKLSGRKLIDYLRMKAFDKIGFSKEAYYMPDPAGVSQGGSGLNCKLRDLLAVAELVLNKGVHNGEQLLPADYLEEATSFQISTQQQPAYDEQLGYGYQIWRGRHDCFYFYGIGGQLAVCLPKEQFVLVTMGNTLENKNGIKCIFDAFFEEIYPYLSESLDCGAEAGGEQGAEGVQEVECLNDGRLCEKVSCAEFTYIMRELPGVPVDVTSAPKYFVNGKEYTFEANMLKISNLQLCLEENSGELHMTKEGKAFDLQFGLHDYAKTTFPWTGAECHCQGAWVMEDMFFIRCYILGPDMANLYICLRFTEDGVTVKMTKGADDAMKNFEGVASGI